MPVTQSEEHDHDGLQESASTQRTTDSARPHGVSRRSERVIREPFDELKSHLFLVHFSV